MYYPGQSDDAERADRASARALELAPQLPEAHASRAFALFQLGRMADAVEHFREAIRLDPQTFEARYFYGRALFQLGRFADAADVQAAAVRETTRRGSSRRRRSRRWATSRPPTPPTSGRSRLRGLTSS
jgi:Tfp pilus assembly protein PilF